MGTLQLPRGTQANLNARTGSISEIAADTTNNQLRLFNGTLSGGYVIPNESRVRAIAQEEDAVSVWFSAYRSSTYTTSAGGSTVLFNAELGDGGADYNTTNGTFTAPSSGIYVFYASILRDSGFNSAGVSPFIRVNGTNYVGGYATQIGTETNGFLSAGVTAVASLSAGDTVTVFQPDEIRILGSSTERRTWFQGHKL